jgi:hypothetical protein
VTTCNFNAGPISEDAVVSVINSSRRAANIKFKKRNEKPNKIPSLIHIPKRLAWWYRELEDVAVEKTSNVPGGVCKKTKENGFPDGYLVTENVRQSQIYLHPMSVNRKAREQHSLVHRCLEKSMKDMRIWPSN